MFSTTGLVMDIFMIQGALMPVAHSFTTWQKEVITFGSHLFGIFFLARSNVMRLIASGPRRMEKDWMRTVPELKRYGSD
jgi:hypothetical protein